MANQPQSQTNRTPRAGETSYEPSRLIRISSNATLLSWLFLLIALLSLALALYLAVDAVVNWSPHANVAGFLVAALPVAFLIQLCVSCAICMGALSEGLFLLRDIEENTRPTQSSR